MVTRVPAQYDVLKWARMSCALTPEAAAKKLKIKLTHLEKIEDGSVSPSVSTFRSMARVYGMPEATLLMEAPVDLPPLPSDFRTFDGQPSVITCNTILAIRRVRERQETLADLAEIDLTVTKPDLPAFIRREVDPEELGESERRRIGFPVAEQLKLTLEKAFLQWRMVVEGQGVSVFIENFPLDDTRGISLYDNDFPAIILSQNEQHFGARSFTLLHEYAHLLIRQPGISDQRHSSSIERFCNQFAGAFLIPRSALVAVFGERPAKAAEIEIHALDEGAKRLSVSMRALALRLEETAYAPSGFYSRVTALLGKPPNRKQKPGQVPQKYLILSHIGHNYTDAVLRTREHGHISSVEASRLLGAPPLRFKELRQTINDRRALLANAAG